MQLIRLLAVVRRSGRNALSRPGRIELDLPTDSSRRPGGVNDDSTSFGPSRRKSSSNNVPASASHARNDFNLDIDLHDDAEATRSRMRDGGDWSAASKSGSRAGQRPGEAERQHLMNDYDHTYHEDDDEEL